MLLIIVEDGPSDPLTPNLILSRCSTTSLGYFAFRRLFGTLRLSNYRLGLLLVVGLNAIIFLQVIGPVSILLYAWSGIRWKHTVFGLQSWYLLVKPEKSFN